MPLVLRLAAALGLVVVLGAVAGIWLGTKASVIKTELTAASQLIPELEESLLQDNSAAAAIHVERIALHTSTAKQAATDPIWTIAAATPWLGANFQAVSTVATSADDVAKLTGVPLVKVIESFDWETLAPNAKGTNLKPLIAAEPTIAAAAHAVRQSSDRLNALHTDGLLPQVSEPLGLARQELSSLREGLETATDAAALAPRMMGASGPRKYLLLIQNNAESRATGGIPGALAVLEVNNGKLTLGKQTSATELGPMSQTITVETEQQQIYSTRVGKFMQDVNLTPDFPTSARTARAMWEQKTGERLDGVVSIDPVALSYLLDATGPVTLSDPRLDELVGGALPTRLSQKNVVPTLLSDVYAALPDPSLQDMYFADVAKELFTTLASGSTDPNKLLRGINKGVADGRILVWSATPEEQSIIGKYPVAGTATGTNLAPAQFGVYFNDGTGAKMDYYVKRSVQLIKECSNNGYGQVRVRVTSTNTAPKDAASSLPAYVTGGGTFGVPAGTVQTNVVAYGPVQSNVENALADGKKISFASHTHSGRPVGAVTVALPPGKKSTIDFVFGKIVQHTEPQMSVTPTVQAREDVLLDTITEKCNPAPQPEN